MPSPDEPNPPDSAPLPDDAEAGGPPLRPSGLGSGLLARQPTPAAEETVAVAKVCPQCGAEYETGDRFCPKDGTALRPKAGGDPLVGRVIADRYLILARLGEGGMGRVYLAEHVKMNRQCAVKVMNPSLMTDTESLQRFAREASSAARILHPNVAAVFDYGEADKLVYLVMEYVDGESLSTIIAREQAEGRRLEPRRAIDLARQIADGLHAAHELGIVHRDLKPDNVIVARTKSGKEVPKVVDFGIAKALTDSQEDALTRSGLVIGTPEYMSPEQLLGDPVDARADIYSLGCILYQMLTGEPAFAAESREQMIRRRLHEAPPHVRDLLPDLPRRLDTLIVHMLARSPGDRLSSAAEARDALDPGLAMGGWDPSTVSAQHPITSVGSPVTSDPSLQPTVPMPKVRTSPRRIAVGAAIGAAVLFGGLGLWRLNQPAEKLGPNRFAKRDTAVASAALPAPVVDTSNKKSLTAKSDSQKAAPKEKPKPAEPTDEVKPVLNPYLDAIRHKNIDAMTRAVPSFGQADAFKGIFSKAIGNVSATASYGAPQSGGPQGVVERDVTITVKSSDQTGAPNVSKFSYHAVYKRQSGQWVLTQFTPKS